MPEESEPVPMKCLDFEEAFQSESVSKGYESPYKNISFLKEDAVTVNSSYSYCSIFISIFNFQQ